jgi:TPR repeat protein
VSPGPAASPACPIGGCGPQAALADTRVAAATSCAGSAASCGGLPADECGRQALRAWSVPQDARGLTCVARALTEACTLGDAKSCGLAGRLWLDGHGVPRDAPRGLSMIVRACDEGEALACMAGARWLADADHVRDAHADTGLHDRLIAEHRCLLGDAAECLRAALSFEGGEGAPRRDATRAVQQYARGCDLGNSLACNAFGVALDYGEGVAREPERAVTAFERACKMGDSLGCANLGYMLENGEGVGADRARARSLYRDSCTSGQVYGCLHDEMLGAQDAGAPRDRQRAFAFWRRACDARDARACAFVGVIYEDGPDGRSRDEAKSQQAMKRACELGNRLACEWTRMRPGD